MSSTIDSHTAESGVTFLMHGGPATIHGAIKRGPDGRERRTTAVDIDAPSLWSIAETACAVRDGRVS